MPSKAIKRAKPSSSFTPTLTRGSPTAGCFPFFPPPTMPSRPTSVGDYARAGRPHPFEFVREFAESTIHHPVPEEFLEKVVSESLKVPARVWRDYYKKVLTVDDTARLGEIGAPTLILWGEQVAVLAREEQERPAAVIPDATLRVYPDTGHLVHWERPEWVVRDLQAFIKGTRRA